MKARYWISSIYALLLLGAFLIFSNCRNQRKHNNYPKHGQQVIDTLDSLFEQLAVLDSNSIDYSESTVSLNENIRKIVEQISTPKLLAEAYQVYQTNRHNYTLAFSEDSTIGVFSWKTKSKNGPFTSIKNVALFERENRLTPTSLYGESVIYQNIYPTITDRDRQVYILESNTDSVLRLDAYEITKNGMEQANIFKNELSQVILSKKDTIYRLDNYLNLSAKTAGL